MKFIAKQLGLHESNISTEETKWNKQVLLKSFLMRVNSRPSFDALTEAQIDSAINVIEHQKEVPMDWGFGGLGNDMWMFLSFRHIYIGIEKDGYHHS